MRKDQAFVIVLLAVFLCATGLSADAGKNEILPLSEVKKGMVGYGLTVFEGDTIEKFDVVIEGVLHNIGPQQDLILARVDSEVIRRAGVVAGMSGSPIFIDGKVIGALAYSWQFAKDPIAGITPIEEMLRLDQPSNGGGKPTGATITSREFLDTVIKREPEAAFEKLLTSFSSRTTLASAGALPIATPLSFSGFAPETIERFGRVLEASGFLAVPSGSSGSSGSSPASAAGPFKAGDAVGAVLVDGDFSLAATGTVTHVDGKRVYGFGHPFLDIGEIEFTMAKSEIVTVMASLARSFKFSNTGEVVGTLKQDRSAGIFGHLGETTEMIPIEITMNGSTGPQTYRLRAVRHHQLFPLIMALATDSVVSAAQRSSGERTVILDSEIKVIGFAPIRLHDGWAGPQA
ncbi:MAG TPA: SpoIVB peptidase S55 domain-containing protein, partial [Thermoanaerobaculia bacterium]